MFLLLEGCGLASFLVVPLAWVVENRWHHYRRRQQAARWALEAHSVTIEAQDDGGYQVIER